MKTSEAFNLNSNILNTYALLFVKLVIAVILIYTIILIINFLKDKFINKVDNAPKVEINLLLILLNKLFFISGFGFIIGNILNVLFSEMGRNRLLANWDYLTFGVILIFVGLSFKAANKALKKESISA
ncbi:hypothetical protein RBH94_02375 [Aestuariibaculum sp. YM273]|uniref:hypothetical protein n=1 Tax=Aestuariibaculum sp. YM273 TaxID=3070659 RepID=UPI0027DE4E48|nr:hypothetical protein [Aestuariibaculum sp. YM273]WMI66014.1 hypothetical protein RBH94_02375 [Aestuariibaculum sp. YM273]